MTDISDPNNPTITISTEPSYPTQPYSVLIPPPSDLKPLYTTRLILRPLEIDSDQHAAGMFRIRSRQDVVDWLWPRTPDTSITDTKTWMSGKLFPAPDSTGGLAPRLFFFIITPKDNENLILGSVGVNSLDPAPSLGYALHPDYWGRGFASEAAGAVVRAWWGLPRINEGVGLGLGLGLREEEGGEEKLYAASNCRNVGSVKVLERVGFEVYEYVHFIDRLAFMAMGRGNLK
ncbi:GNAT domain-containing protein [Aspergillus cavernicola]|uniref:GNAT domain-containing protein n=1 Tax=Aspergillus cavernicola TaxID=176166 RepID=A0ABR4I7U8_9EURO